jgi:hypothetical protein
MSNTIFNKSIVWKSKFDTEDMLYLIGITQTKYNLATLENSKDPDYDTNTAYFLISQDPGSKNRKINLKQTDIITLTGLNANVNFGIDDSKGLLVFDPSSPISDPTSITASVVKNVASIWKRNQETPQFLIDFTYQNERVILSLESSDDGLFLGGASGKIWFYDGIKIKEVFELNIGTPKPATAMVKAQFAHETESYLYVGSDDSAGLFRAKLSEAKYGNTWEYLTGVGPDPGGILSMTFAYNKIFMGLRNNIFASYEIEPTLEVLGPTTFASDQNTQVLNENGIVTLNTLVPDNISDFSNDIVDIQCLEKGHNQIFAGISDRPEVWSYSEVPINNPLNDEEWATQIFDRTFVDDPAPAQYYSNGGVTNSRLNSNVSHLFLDDFTSPSSLKSAVLLNGEVNSETAFEFSVGSDWEQSLDKTQTQLPYNEVDCATTSNIAMSYTEAPVIDGFQMKEGSSILIKDQNTASQNGIYTLFYSNGSYSFVRANFNTASSVRVGFLISNGYVNANSRFLLNVSDIENNTFIFYKPSHTIELEMFNAGFKKYSNEDAEPYWIGNDVAFGTSGYIDLQDNLPGYQGIEVSDGYRQYKLEFNSSNIRLSSGNNIVSKALPAYGFLKNWNFYDSRTTSNWVNAGFFTNLSVQSLAQYLPDGTAKVTNVLYLDELGKTGSPRITNSAVNVSVDINTKVLIKLKINAPTGFTVYSGKLKFSWLYGNGTFENWTSVDIKNNDGFVLYELSPNWYGTVKQVAIELEGLPEQDKRPLNAYIDYIQFVNTDSFFNINLFPSNVRIITEDKDIKVFLGNQTYPVINMKNFVIADTYKTSVADYDAPKIKIGKLTPENDESLFGYTRLRFIAGEAYAPTSKKILELHNTTRFPSSGGVRILTFHDGALYAVCDGMSTNKISDNPDDRQIKIFKYEAANETWKKEDAQFIRKINSNTGDILGIIRALTAKSYNQSLYLSGQYGSIKYDPNR